MTVNDLERCNSPYFAFFSLISIALQADYVTVVEDKPIMSVKYCLPVPVFHFWLKLTHPAARSLFMAEHLVIVHLTSAVPTLYYITKSCSHVVDDCCTP